jgi:hypothetical protein
MILLLDKRTHLVVMAATSRLVQPLQRLPLIFMGVIL